MSNQLPRIEQRDNGKAVLIDQAANGSTLEIDLFEGHEEAPGMPDTLKMIVSSLMYKGSRSAELTIARLMSEYGAACYHVGFHEGSKPSESPKAAGLRLVDTMRLQLRGEVR